MTNRNRVVLVAGAAAAIAAIALSANRASSTPSASGTEVVLEVERIAAPAGRAVAAPQYLCSAKLQRVGGEVLAQPRIAALQGVPASVTTTTESGSKVALKVLVSAPNRVSDETDITSPQGSTEHHRATITLPEQRE